MALKRANSTIESLQDQLRVKAQRQVEVKNGITVTKKVKNGELIKKSVGEGDFLKMVKTGSVDQLRALQSEN